MILFCNLIGTACGRRRKSAAFAENVARLIPSSVLGGVSLGPGSYVTWYSACVDAKY